MSQRQEFVLLASDPAVNFSALCTRFGISRPCGYKWLKRYRETGDVCERSRRPRNSPQCTSSVVEDRVLSVIGEPHKRSWGGRKIHRHLLDQGLAANEVPAASTITGILRRRGIARLQVEPKRSWKRFERSEPNDLWQMDFKGHFLLQNGKRCYPLTIVDDHSRYAIGVIACPNECFATVRTAVTAAFIRYGLPRQIVTDNGNPWGSSLRSPYGPAVTTMQIWLLRLGVELLHSRPKHPQTCGKCERFNQTLKREVLNYHTFRSRRHCQEVIDQWRRVYNLERPHESLGDAAPVSRYRISPVRYTDELAPVVYPESMAVRSVTNGTITYKGKRYQIGEALTGYQVGVEQHPDGRSVKVYFCDYLVRTLAIKQ